MSTPDDICNVCGCEMEWADTYCADCSAKMKSAYLATDGWAGRRRHKVFVLDETPKRYRVMLDEKELRMRSGRRRRGSVFLVPKAAVTFRKGGGDR